MKKLIILPILLLTGCASMQSQIDDVLDVVSKVGNVEYHRTGIWTDSDLSIHLGEDGLRTAHYNLRTKTPLGPSVSIMVEGIKLED